MRIQYYPGCTLRTKAKNLDHSTKIVATTLGVELNELPEWVCCGAVPPLVTDNVMKLLAPIRNLKEASRRGDTLTTTCAFCFNILKQSNHIMIEDPEKRWTINRFLEEEEYTGTVRVLHFLEVLRDLVGSDAIKEKVQSPLRVPVATYYGCLLLRPAPIIRLDNPEDPTILENLLQNIGCTVIEYPYRNECCGSFITISAKDLALERTQIILSSAVRNGAEAIVVSCPLCHFNLDYYQTEIQQRDPSFTQLPILYFTQALGIAFGHSNECGLDQHYIDPRPLLKGNGNSEEDDTT